MVHRVVWYKLISAAVMLTASTIRAIAALMTEAVSISETSIKSTKSQKTVICKRELLK
jgi:hypothetical protein